MSKVRNTAQQAIDLFYLQYATSADFLQNDWWERQALITRNQIINEEFVASKKGDIDSQQELASLYEYFDADVTKVKGTENYEAIIPVPFFIFQFDRFSSGVQYISPTKTACGELIRIRKAEAWAACKSPIKNVAYWYADAMKIIFVNIKAGCLKKVNIALIPSFDCADNMSEQIIPDGIEGKVIAAVVAQAFDAWMRRNGKIDQTNDQNQNVNSDQSGNVFKNERTA